MHVNESLLHYCVPKPSGARFQYFHFLSNRKTEKSLLLPLLWSLLLQLYLHAQILDNFKAGRTSLTKTTIKSPILCIRQTQREHLCSQRQSNTIMWNDEFKLNGNFSSHTLCSVALHHMYIVTVSNSCEHSWYFPCFIHFASGNSVAIAITKHQNINISELDPPSPAFLHCSAVGWWIQSKLKLNRKILVTSYSFSCMTYLFNLGIKDN